MQLPLFWRKGMININLSIEKFFLQSANSLEQKT